MPPRFRYPRQGPVGVNPPPPGNTAGPTFAVQNTGSAGPSPDLRSLFRCGRSLVARNETPRRTFLCRPRGDPQHMEVMMRKIFSMVIVAGALAVSACNTVEGVGKDVSSAGDAVSGAANETK